MRRKSSSCVESSQNRLDIKRNAKQCSDFKNLREVKETPVYGLGLKISWVFFFRKWVVSVM